MLSLSWPERRLANIHKLLRLARRFEAAEGRDLRGFLDHVAHRGAFAQGAEPEAPTGGAEPDAVRLMTIHAAKGLEFPVVCVADLGRTGKALAPDLLLDGERVGLRLVGLDGSEPVACLDYEELCEERRRAAGGRGGADRLRRDDPRPRAAAAERRRRLRALARGASRGRADRLARRPRWPRRCPRARARSSTRCSICRSARARPSCAAV